MCIIYIFCIFMLKRIETKNGGINGESGGGDIS